MGCFLRTLISSNLRQLEPVHPLSPEANLKIHAMEGQLHKVNQFLDEFFRGRG